MAIEGKNRSPAQTFGLAPNKIPKFGDAELNPKPTVTRPSRERMPFGPSRESAKGVSAGVLKPDGPGPFPDDIFSATDIVGLPWTRRRGDEWTDATFRALVLTFLATFFRARASQRLIGWDVTEIANGARMGSTRLSAKDQYLRFGITRRVGRDGTARVEVAVPFPPSERVTPRTEVQLALAEGTLDVLLAAIG